MTTQIIFTCPAYDVIEGPAQKFAAIPAIVLQADDMLANADHPMRHYMIGSVVSSAMRSGDCPIKAIERAQSFKHEMHFIFALGTMLTDHKQPRKTYIGVRIGQRVRFEGRYFEITATPNNNLGLKDVTDPATL